MWRSLKLFVVIYVTTMSALWVLERLHPGAGKGEQALVLGAVAGITSWVLAALEHRAERRKTSPPPSPPDPGKTPRISPE